MSMEIDRQTVKLIGERILELTKDAIKKEFGLDVTKTGGSFSPTVFNLKLQIATPLSDAKPVPVTESMLRMGLAGRGTKVRVGAKEYIIVTARRTKYIVER